MGSDERPDPFLLALPQMDDVPPALRDLHSRPGTYSGRCDIERGKGLLIANLLRIGRFPGSGRDLPVKFVTRSERDHHIWSRDFAGHITRSHLYYDGHRNCVREKLGGLTMWLRPVLTQRGLSIEIERLTVFGIPCPAILLPRSATLEWQDAQGRFRFDVSAEVPGLGRLIRYHGWLTRDHDGIGAA